MSIIINVNTEWVFNNLNNMEQQCMVFSSTRLSLITVFDNIGCLLNHWYPTVGPSKQASGTHAWAMPAAFYDLIATHYMTISHINIRLDVENDFLSVSSANCNTFVWKEYGIDVDSCTSWTLDHQHPKAIVSYDWRFLQQIVYAARELDDVTLTVGDEAVWSGEVWRHSGSDLGIKKRGATTRFRGDILFRVFENIPYDIGYGENRIVSILKNNLLMIEAVDAQTGDMIRGYVAPIKDYSDGEDP